MVATPVSETYPLYDVIRAIESEAMTSMGHYHDMTPAQHQSTLQRIVDLCGRFRRAVTCRGSDTHLPPRALGPVPAAGPSSRPPRPPPLSGAPQQTLSAPTTPPTYMPRPAQLFSGAADPSLFSPMDPYGAGSSSSGWPIRNTSIARSE